MQRIMTFLIQIVSARSSLTSPLLVGFQELGVIIRLFFFDVFRYISWQHFKKVFRLNMVVIFFEPLGDSLWVDGWLRIVEEVLSAGLVRESVNHQLVLDILCALVQLSQVSLYSLNGPSCIDVKFTGFDPTQPHVTELLCQELEIFKLFSEDPGAIFPLNREKEFNDLFAGELGGRTFL